MAHTHQEGNVEQQGTKPVDAIAEICLYGVTAAGWLARTKDGRMFGTGDPVAGRSFTEAIWQAAAEMTAAGLPAAGTLLVFAPGGERMAALDLARPIPTFGDLRWGRAPVYTITIAELEAAAAQGAQQ